MTAAVFIAAGGCESDPLRPVGLKDLEDPNPNVRIRAIKWAGENKVEQAVPLLVDRLQEQDESVRFFAIVALRQITGHDNGFDYKADAAKRAEAVQKWRDEINQTSNVSAP